MVHHLWSVVLRSHPGDGLRSVIALLTVALPTAALLACSGRSRSAAPAATSGGCDPELTLPPGFCAKVIADSIGPARDVAVRSNGDVFVAVLRARHETGGVLLLRDSTGSGRVDVASRIGNEPAHGVALANDSTLYVSTATAIYRYRFAGEAVVPRKKIDTVVAGLPSGPVPSHTIALDARGNLIVAIAALSNACQRSETRPGSAGQDPCPELETSAGIWRFRTDKTNQRLSDGIRIATGLHDPIALAVNPSDTMVYAISQGRDSLHELWPEHFDELAGATHVAEELVRVASSHADFGWPYCYYDAVRNLRVLAPEYGGDGVEEGRCQSLIQPLLPIPAHWAPMAMLFHSGTMFPAKYKEGVFVSCYGSAGRSPLPEEGYDIVFVPFAHSLPTADLEVFADGFAGGIKSPDGARHRPVGMAEGHDGSLYVSDDKGGRIWRIVYAGH